MIPDKQSISEVCVVLPSLFSIHSEIDLLLFYAALPMSNIIPIVVDSDSEDNLPDDPIHTDKCSPSPSTPLFLPWLDEFQDFLSAPASTGSGNHVPPLPMIASASTSTSASSEAGPSSRSVSSGSQLSIPVVSTGFIIPAQPSRNIWKS